MKSQQKKSKNQSLKVCSLFDKVNKSVRVSVDKHFKNRWKTVKDRPETTVVDFLDILLENKSKLSFV